MNRPFPLLIVGLLLTFGGTHNLSAQFARENNTVGITFPSQNFQGFIYNDSSRDSARTNRDAPNLNRRAETARRGETFRDSQGRGISSQSSAPTVDPRQIAEQGLRDPFVGPPARLPPVSQRLALQQSQNRDISRDTSLVRERFARDPFEHRASTRLVQRPLEATPYQDVPRIVANPTPGLSARRDPLPQSRVARAYPFLQDRQ